MGCFRSSEGLHFNPLWHSLSILLTLTSCVIFFLVVFYNAPLDHAQTTLEGKVGLRMWLLTVNETSQTAVLDLDRRAVENTASVMGQYTTLAGRDGGGGIYAYGLGMWGWCEWSNTDWLGHAKCTRKAFWTLPRSALPAWDGIDQVIRNFPYAIRHALSGVSFLLVFVPFLTLAYLATLILAIRFPGPYPPWPVPPASKRPKEARKSVRTRIAWDLRRWQTQLQYFCVIAIFLLPTIVTVCIGRYDINASTNDRVLGGSLVAAFGNGFTAIVVGWVVLILAQLLCMWKTGLVMKREDKVRSNRSKG
ncbi:hypothetical protein IAU60_000234 [Kwoniella sp. DSM 27419]